MFESGRALFDPTADEHVTRRWALSLYGWYGFIGLFGVAVGLWKYGVSQPIHIAASAAAFLLSLVWLRTTLKSGPPTRRGFSLRLVILMLLGVGPSYISGLYK
jgi:hypothetical protein